MSRQPAWPPFLALLGRQYRGSGFAGRVLTPVARGWCVRPPASTGTEAGWRGSLTQPPPLPLEREAWGTGRSVTESDDILPSSPFTGSLVKRAKAKKPRRLKNQKCARSPAPSRAGRTSFAARGEGLGAGGSAGGGGGLSFGAQFHACLALQGGAAHHLQVPLPGLHGCVPRGGRHEGEEGGAREGTESERTRPRGLT